MILKNKKFIFVSLFSFIPAFAVAQQQDSVQQKTVENVAAPNNVVENNEHSGVPLPSPDLLNTQMRSAILEQQLDVLRKEVEFMRAKIEREQALKSLKEISGGAKDLPIVIAMMVGDNPSALLMDMNGRQFWVSVGSKIDGIVVVEKIDKEGVFVRSSGKRLTRLDDFSPKYSHLLDQNENKNSSSQVGSTFGGGVGSLPMGRALPMPNMVPPPIAP